MPPEENPKLKPHGKQRGEGKQSKTSDEGTNWHVRRKGAAPLSGTKEQTARAISAHAQYACLLSLQMGSIN
jgi:hypothetical protein